MDSPANRIYSLADVYRWCVDAVDVRQETVEIRGWALLPDSSIT